MNIHSPSGMKNLLYYLLLFAIVACQQDPVDKRMDGCIGASFFYLSNQSSRSLSVEFLGPKLNQQLDPATVIAPQQQVLIGQDAIFGYTPRPADTFSSFTLYSLVNGQKSVVFTQAPAQTALWIKKKQSPSDPDFGCQQVDYTLTVTDALLK